MLHYVKRHLTPELAREHFCAGKGNRSLFGLSRRTKENLEKRKDLPVITEDVVIEKHDGCPSDDGTESRWIVFEKQGRVIEDYFLSGDYRSSTDYNNVHIGQKFYVASWPCSRQHPLFYAQDYWRLEELSPEERAWAAEVEQKAVDDFAQNLDALKAGRIADRYLAPAELNQTDYRGTCHRYLVPKNLEPQKMTFACRIAVQFFGKSLSAALEYLARERDPVAKERYKNLLNRDELEAYNKTADWFQRTIREYLNNTVIPHVVKEIVPKYADDPRRKIVSKRFFESKTMAEYLAVRHFFKSLNSLMEYVIVHHDVETNSRFVDMLTDEEYEVYQNVMNKIRHAHQI